MDERFDQGGLVPSDVAPDQVGGVDAHAGHVTHATKVQPLEPRAAQVDLLQLKIG